MHVSDLYTKRDGMWCTYCLCFDAWLTNWRKLSSTSKSANDADLRLACQYLKFQIMPPRLSSSWQYRRRTTAFTTIKSAAKFEKPMSFGQTRDSPPTPYATTQGRFRFLVRTEVCFWCTRAQNEPQSWLSILKMAGRDIASLVQYVL